jgi:hypothetical protein
MFNYYNINSFYAEFRINSVDLVPQSLYKGNGEYAGACESLKHFLSNTLKGISKL